MTNLVEKYREMKKRGEKVTALTGYDYPTARLLDESGIDIILVGDSLGMVVLGYEDTTPVTLEEMLHHTRATARGVKNALLVGDMPIHTFDTPEQAVATAKKFVEAGAQGVKLEGGVSHVAHIEAITRAEIPFMAHIGMLPQQVREQGGYKVKGKTQPEAEALIADAKAVEKAGSSGDGRAVVAAMKAIPTEDPLFGHGTIREDGRHLHPMYLLEVKTPAESKAEWDVFKISATIPADKAFRPLNEGQCPLVAK